MTEAKFVPLTCYREYPPDEMRRRAAAFRAEMQRRRSVRTFSSRPVAREVIEDCLLTAGSAPSGGMSRRGPRGTGHVDGPVLGRRFADPLYG